MRWLVKQWSMALLHTHWDRILTPQVCCFSYTQFVLWENRLPRAFRTSHTDCMWRFRLFCFAERWTVGKFRLNIHNAMLLSALFSFVCVSLSHDGSQSLNRHSWMKLPSRFEIEASLSHRIANQNTNLRKVVIKVAKSEISRMLAFKTHIQYSFQWSGPRKPQMHSAGAHLFNSISREFPILLTIPTFLYAYHCTYLALRVRPYLFFCWMISGWMSFFLEIWYFFRVKWRTRIFYGASTFELKRRRSADVSQRWRLWP